MQQITLQPAVWTRLNGRLFQVKGQQSVCITVAETSTDVNKNQTIIPPATDAPCFITQSYDPTPIDLEDWGIPSHAPVFLKPVDDQTIDLVVL